MSNIKIVKQIKLYVSILVNIDKHFVLLHHSLPFALDHQELNLESNFLKTLKTSTETFELQKFELKKQQTLQ